MNRTGLEASWLTTRGHLESAWAMLPSPTQEDPEEGGAVSDFDEWMAYNELELALYGLAALGAA